MLIIIQLATLIIAAASLYFSYKDKKVTVFGTALYMLFPYRLYIGFDLKDRGMSAFYMLLPLVLLFVKKVYSDNRLNDEKKNDSTSGVKRIRKSLLWLIPLTVVLTAMSFADTTLFIVFAVVFMVCVLGYKRYWAIPAVAVAGLASIPVNINYWRFILLGHQNQYAAESVLIAGKGYYVGNFFMSWIYREDLPGVGFGLLFSMVLILWYLMNGERKINYKLVIIAVVLSFLSMHLGIWDVAERIHPVMLRFISKMGSPNVLFGMACALLCIPSMQALRKLCDNKITFVSKVIPWFIIAMNVVSAVHLVVYL